MASEAALPGLPRGWWGTELPGYREPLTGFATYSMYPGDLPPIQRELDDRLSWLLAQPRLPDSLAGNAASPEPTRPARRAELEALLGRTEFELPVSFSTFIYDPDHRTRVRSCTACYLDLADTAVPADDGALLIHFLSDQQWVLHWLLYLGRDGREAVVATETPYGFDTPEASSSFEPQPDRAIVCAESFGEFLYRFWIENEIWFALADPDEEPQPLTEEQRRYVEYYVAR